MWLLADGLPKLLLAPSQWPRGTAEGAAPSAVSEVGVDASTALCKIKFDALLAFVAKICDTGVAAAPAHWHR